MAILEKTQLGVNHWRVSVALDPSDYKHVFEKELRKYQANVNIKGFRKGQTPLSVIKQLHGKHIFHETLTTISNKELFASLEAHEGNKEHVLEPILLYQDFDILKIDTSVDYTRIFEYAIVPALTEDVLSQIELVNPVLIPDDETINKYKKSELGLFENRIEAESVQPNDLLYVALLPYEGQDIEGLKATDALNRGATLSLIEFNSISEACKNILLHAKAESFYGPVDVYDLDTRLDVKSFNNYILRNAELVDNRIENDQYLVGVFFINRVELVEPDPKTLHYLYNDQVNSTDDIAGFIKDQLLNRLSPSLLKYGSLEMMGRLVELLDNQLPLTFFENQYEQLENPELGVDLFVFKMKREVMQTLVNSYVEVLEAANKEVVQRASRDFISQYFHMFNTHQINDKIEEVNGWKEKEEKENRDFFNDLRSYIVFVLLKDVLTIRNVTFTDKEQFEVMLSEQMNNAFSYMLPFLNPASSGTVVGAIEENAVVASDSSAD